MNGEELQNHMEKHDDTIALLQMAADTTRSSASDKSCI